MSTRPSFQFYARDWLTCPELRRCCVAARGLWADLLALAHFGEPYGHLASAGRPYEPAELARLTGCTRAEITRLLAELERNQVCSRAADGAIYSRRMVRDGESVERRKTGGEAGAEHGSKGAEHGSKGGRPKTSRGVFEASEKPPSTPPSDLAGKPPSKPPPSSASASASDSASPSAQQPPPASGDGSPGFGAGAIDPPQALPSGSGGLSADDLQSAFDLASARGSVGKQPAEKRRKRAPRRQPTPLLDAPAATSEAKAAREHEPAREEPVAPVGAAEASGPHASFIAWWCKRFEVETGTRYPFTPRDAKHVAAIRELAHEDLSLMQQAGERMFATEYWQHRGFSLKALLDEFPALISARPRDERAGQRLNPFHQQLVDGQEAHARAAKTSEEAVAC